MKPTHCSTLMCIEHYLTVLAFLLLLLLLLLLLCSSKNYLYAVQLKGTQGAKAWPVLRLVKLELIKK